MPFSFTQIEKDKSSTIGFVFSFLVVFYFVVAFALCFVIKGFFIVEMHRHERVDMADFWFSWGDVIIILCLALIVGIIHWLISTNNIVQKILNTLKAQPLNLQDTYHSKFNNILQEISVATGGVKFEGAVISSTSMNAFALADFEDRYVIGVTEGLLSRLNRAQLETVIAHEAAHILTGDCLQTTITSSMFDLYKDMLSTSKELLSNSRRDAFVLVVIIYVILQCTYFISQLFKMFISREREYRADAIAVRLTRDPLSLAQSLYMISRFWRGYGIPGDGLDAIFIVPPQYYEIEDQEGLFADLFSTHPPVNKRLSVLLDMAHSNMKDLESEYNRNVQAKVVAPDFTYNVIDKTQTPITDPAEFRNSKWEVFDNGQWRGPYLISDLMNSEWISYDCFVRKIGDQKIVRLFEAADIKRFNISGGFIPKGFNCPICQIPLLDDMYNGAPISRCSNCAGIFLYEVDVEKILSRDDYVFSDKIRSAADSIIKQQLAGQIKPLDLKTVNLLYCTRCSDPKPQMFRAFYTLAYPVVVDRCTICKSVWFDQGELQILQYMIKKYQNNDVPKLL